MARRYVDSARSALGVLPDSEIRACLMQVADHSIGRAS
jgi:geranylgeranyl pyrophosphate synthase